MTQRIVNYKYGTGNPVLPDGSIDVRDGIDNLQSFDVFMNADEDTYNQRDGEIVRTVAGMNNEFDAQILNMGFTRIGTFASGATITNPRQTLLWDIADGGDGQEYGWSGLFPPSGKVVPPGSTPLTTGGIAVGAWISRFDPELRIQVYELQRRSYAEAGYDLIGRFSNTGLVVNSTTDVVLWEPTGVAYSYSGGLPHTIAAAETPVGNPLWGDRSDELLIGSASFSAIRVYNGAATKIYCYGRNNVFDGGFGYFYLDAADTTSADNDGTCLIDALGRRWKRVFSGEVSLLWFCERGDGVSDLTAGLIKAITYCATNKLTLNWAEGKYRFSQINIAIPYGYFHWTASGKVELICTSNVVGNVGRAISLGGVANPTLHNFTTRDISLGEAKITLDNVSDIAIGDLLVIRNNHVVRGDNRGSWQEGQITQVTSLTGNVVGLDQDAYYQYRSGGNTTVTVTGATSGQSFSAAAFSVSSPPRDALYKLLGLTGANAGLTKMTTAYDDATKTFTVGSDAGTGFPNTPAVGDTFRLVRQAEAWAVKAATFNIVGDFHVKTSQGLITTATAGQVAYDGIVFEYCVNGLARFAYVENFPNTGITLLGCLRCTVLDTSLYGINRVHSGDGGTGDAVSIANSSYCTVENINVSCSRRGVDVGGSNWSSLYNNVGGITMRGGGVGYAGGIIFPSEGWTEFSYGFGSHGGAAETKYRNNVAADCFYGATIRGFNEIVSGCEIRGFSNLPVRLYYGSGTTITDTHYVDGFTETTGPSNKWWKATNSGNRKLRPGAFIWMTPTYTLETPTVIKGCSAKSTTREFVVVDTEVVAPAKIDGVLISGCTVYVDNSDATSGNTDAYMLRINGGPALGDNFGLGGANQMILVGSNNTVSSGKLFHASGTCEGAVRKSEGVWEVFVEANTSQSFPVGKSNMAFCVDVINDGGPGFFAGLNMLLTPDSAVDGSPLAAMNKTNLVINATNIATPTKMGISIVNGRLYFNNGTATDIRATVRVATV